MVLLLALDFGRRIGWRRRQQAAIGLLRAVSMVAGPRVVVGTRLGGPGCAGAGAEGSGGGGRLAGVPGGQAERRPD